MREKVKMLTACVCAAAWWSVFYPELCFTEDTCQLIQTVESQSASSDDGTAQTAEAGKNGQDAAAQVGQTDTAAGILRAGDGEVVIRSRFLEWCEETLLEKKE